MANCKDCSAIKWIYTSIAEVDDHLSQSISSEKPMSEGEDISI
jgi:hypothetical protein